MARSRTSLFWQKGLAPLEKILKGLPSFFVGAESALNFFLARSPPSWKDEQNECQYLPVDSVYHILLSNPWHDIHGQCMLCVLYSQFRPGNESDSKADMAIMLYRGREKDKSL